MKTHASFAIIFKEDGICSVNRLKQGLITNIGLPGGKLEESETPIEAAIRESHEEGWDITNIIFQREICIQVIDNNLVSYVLFVADVKELTEYKEKYRGIIPRIASEIDINHSGMGNSLALQLAKDIYQIWKQK
jgi:hypothetical protein